MPRGRTLPFQTHPSEAGIDFGDALVQIQADSLAAEWALELLAADPMQPDYMQLRVRALLLDERIPEAREAIDGWVERTGDSSARAELEAMIGEVEGAQARRDSARIREGGGQ